MERIVSQLIACMKIKSPSVSSEKPSRVTMNSCVVLISKEPEKFVALTGTGNHAPSHSLHFHICNPILRPCDLPLLDKVPISDTTGKGNGQVLNKSYSPDGLIKRPEKKGFISMEFGHLVLTKGVSDCTSDHKYLEEMFSCWPPPLFILGVSLLQLAVFVFYGSSLDECSTLVS